MSDYWIAPTAVAGQFLFVKLLGFCFLFAFYSLSQQVLGLFGSQGILPIDDYMHMAKQKITKRPFWVLPTIFWYNSSDKFLKFTTNLGLLFSIFIILDLLPAIFLLLCVILYISFMNTGNEFLSFQWDALLIEAGFVGVLYAIQTPPPVLVVILAWVLLFRLLFSSGIVKLLSGCPEWRNLTAMQYHHETQPLPNRGGYYAHNFFKNWTQLTTLFVHILEIVVPFLLLGNDFTRMLAAILSIFLQLLIMATGNYAFFNILTIALCFTAIDDRYLSWLPIPTMNALTPNLPLSIALNSIAAIMILLNVFMLLRTLTYIRFIEKIFYPFASLHLFNSYGLFAVMTTRRDEIILEGSQDGITWVPYEFYWKPGDLHVAPKQVAPFQPRLDWQMWFASLSHYRKPFWFEQLLARILLGSKEVGVLFKTNPFKERPPKYVRALFYQYHFTSFKEKKETGNWWKRTYIGLYSPPMSLKAE